MKLLIFKCTVFLFLFLPLICSSKTPSAKSKNPSQNGAATMDEPLRKFPVKSFDLNSEEEIDALFALHKARKADVKNQSELGIHGVFSVRNADDIPKIMETYERLAKRLSVFEIKFMNDINTRAFVPISASKRQMKIVVSGASDKVIDITGVSFALFADSIHLHHLKWKDMGIKPIVSVGVKENLELDHLTVADNKYDEYYKDIVEPRIIVTSIAEDGKLANVVIKDLTFKNNQTKSLLFIEDDSIEKFSTLSFDHLTLKDNKTISMGIDISAVKNVTLSNSSISGHSVSPALVQRTPLAEVSILNSKIQTDAYQYIPVEKYKDKPAKSVKIK